MRSLNMGQQWLRTSLRVPAMTLLTPPQNPPIKPKKKIGFEVKEYRACPVKFGDHFSGGFLWQEDQEKSEKLTL